jgi:hypothetical protein
MLRVFILRVVMLSDANRPVKLSVLMLRVVTLGVIYAECLNAESSMHCLSFMLSVLLLRVITLSDTNKPIKLRVIMLDVNYAKCCK